MTTEMCVHRCIKKLVCTYVYYEFNFNHFYMNWNILKTCSLDCPFVGHRYQRRRVGAHRLVAIATVATTPRTMSVHSHAGFVPTAQGRP